MNKGLHKNDFLEFFKRLKYSDIEPLLLWGGIILYLAAEYLQSYFAILSRVKNGITPIFIVAVVKLTLSKIDALSRNTGNEVGYLLNVIPEGIKEIKRPSKIQKIRIFSTDGNGFLNSISGKDFHAKEIIVMMNKGQKSEDKEERWRELEKRNVTEKVTIVYHDFDRFIYGMTFDNKIGFFGFFRPDCIADQESTAHTFNTYSCKAESGETSLQLILDFNNVFDSIYDKLKA